MKLEVMSAIADKTREKVRDALGLDDAMVEEAKEVLRTWLATQPHLPDCEDDDVLENWLIKCKNSIEKTKKALDTYYALRFYNPEVMTGWDTNGAWFDVTMQYGYIFSLPELTSELDRVIVIGYSSHGLDDNYNVMNSIKIMILTMELRLLEDYNLKDIFIVDLKHFGLNYIKVLTFSIIKKLQTCFLNGYRSRMKALHFINTPAYADALVTIVKAVLKNKLASRLYVHGTDLTEFHKMVPRKILPKEMGGESGTMQEHSDRWIVKLKNNCDIFKNREQLKSDESRRPNRESFEHEMFGADGSFRKLNID